MTPYGSQVYKTNELETSPPWKILIMSYETIIKNLKIAKEAIKKKDFFVKSKSISKAQMIILTLISMLDQSQDKEIVGSLTSLYFYYTKELTIANAENSIERIDNVIGLIDTLKSGWEEAFSKMGLLVK
ncbi:MAG TPA: flagellar export chaperone FliS [Thermodesulfobium narugense]|uniref:Flagellar secretion chaperone FliS n=1 Tax=Thermodesulfobium acidiphilum TaxID=1794699 RepID=A0A2R4VYM8_THEAF|nr:flagellar export chaperone FliS [Thermodesulfobium acidiphilum]AWB09546.1 flagellar protein FliS [Thermodesulfobium acidiphilum]HEM56432.1 flagellar export chaperone FliS [Thermodesulfobium narugense]